MKNVFLTGGTGTIGSALVPRLLADDDTVLTLLIRARDDADLHARLAEMLGYWQYQQGDSRASRIRPLRGDISLPQQSRIAHQTAARGHLLAAVRCR